MSDDLFSYGPRNIKEFLKENFVAILWTVIIHLAVIIILVFASSFTHFGFEPRDTIKMNKCADGDLNPGHRLGRPRSYR